MRIACVAAVLSAGALAAGCGGSSRGPEPANPVAARSSAWVRRANAFCRPRDIAIRRAENAAAPVFYTPAVEARIRAEAAGLRRLGLFERIPLVAYKWRIASNALRISTAPVFLDQQLKAVHRAAEPYGVRCRFGTLPLSRIPGG